MISQGRVQYCLCLFVFQGSIVRRTLHDLHCLVYSLQTILRLSQRARRHFITLIGYIELLANVNIFKFKSLFRIQSEPPAFSRPFLFAFIVLSISF